MLKIIDSTGETVGILDDEDSAPKMKKNKKVKKEGDDDGTMGTVANGGESSIKTETSSGS